MILILSEPGDTTAGLVVPRLTGPCLWWDPASFPGESRITASLAGGERRIVLTTGGVPYDLGQVSAIWDRRPGQPRIPVVVTDPAHREWAASTAAELLEGVWASLPARRLPGRREDVRLAQNKLVHLARAAELGFSVPETVMTNDPAELAPFWERTGGELVTKTTYPADLTLYGERHHAYTSAADRRHLRARHRLRHAPAILQPNVPKAVELRVTVVGERVFTAEIDSQAGASTRQDWRHYEDSAERYRAGKLPGEVEARCVELVRSFGLSFGALDLIVTPEGEHVFVDLNPNGQWAWIEDLTGLPISAAVAEWLAA
ncbi:ATP-dependent carboxylate-amine ligase [Nonomuraea sp. NPDC050328]|uniref:ATP-dependent carboxylate-amine ligase n=1 Tax=Nonomuraea sp. NPDC050328 TaxID=3364361 RepID=UPI00379B7EDA